MNRICFMTRLALALSTIALPLCAQEADARPDKEIVAEQYLLLGTATRGSGESMIAINPVNPNQIAVAAMGVLHQNEGKFEHNEIEFQRTPRATLTQFAISRDRGLTWTIIEDPMRAYFHRYRCLDPFAAFTPDGTMILGCEAHFPINLGNEEQIDAALHANVMNYGGSAMIWSSDGGRTFSEPVQVISTYMPKELYGPFVSFAPSGPTGDAPKIKSDATTGKIYVSGHSGSAGAKPHSQDILRMSKDRGRNWGMVYAFDSEDWPGSGGSFDAAHGTVGTLYTASEVPAELHAKCPCAVFGASTDDGKTFDRHLILAGGSPPERGPGRDMFVAADPTKAGRFAVVLSSGKHLNVFLTEDSGKTWTGPKPLGEVPSTRIDNITAGYSPKGVLAASWRVVLSDAPAGRGGPGGGRGGPGGARGGPHVFQGNKDPFEMWSAISRDGGKNFSAPMKTSTSPSPGVPRRRGSSDHSADYNSLAVDDDFVHMTWFDNRSGFLGTWYGRVPLADYK